VDEISFLEPVHVGDVVQLKASVNDVGTTSLECGVRVEAENPIGGRTVHAATAYFVFVALDDDGRPRAVPPIAIETEIERRRQRAAKLRRAARMQHKEALREERESSPA
jgi:acyl-CoA hydrolase